MGEITHAGTLSDRPVGQSDPEELDPAVRARPRVVPIVAAMRASPGHAAPNRIKPDPTQMTLSAMRGSPIGSSGSESRDPRHERDFFKFFWGLPRLMGVKEEAQNRTLAIYLVADKRVRILCFAAILQPWSFEVFERSSTLSFFFFLFPF